MAQNEDSLLMIYFIIFFCSFLVLRGLSKMAKAIEQAEYEKRRFYLLVAEELDRLDKIAKEQSEFTKPRKATQWELRN